MRHKIIPAAILILCVMMLSSCAVTPAKSFKITEYGAVGDAKTLNTAAINKALLPAQKRAAARLQFRREYSAQGR